MVTPLAFQVAHMQCTVYYFNKSFIVFNAHVSFDCISCRELKPQ